MTWETALWSLARLAGFLVAGGGRRHQPRGTRTAGVRHLSAALERGEDKLYGHIKPRKARARFPEFCR